MERAETHWHQDHHYLMPRSVSTYSVKETNSTSRLYFLFASFFAASARSLSGPEAMPTLI